MQIDFLGMQAFLSIVEHGGFQQAAAHLNLSQTAISHRIRKLEGYLGARLLTRTTRQVTLTDAGRALLPGVRNAVRELESSYDALRRHTAAAPDWLAFGCLPTLAASQLSPVLHKYALAHPNVAVRVFDDTVNEIAEHVESEAAAFGISIVGAPRPGLAVDIFAEEPFLLVCPAGHRLAGLSTVSWRDLTAETLIRISLPAGNAATIDDALNERRADFHWGYEAQHTALALDFVAAGLGVTVVPALSVQSFPGVVSRPLMDPAIMRRLTVVTRRGQTLAPAAQTLCDLVVAQIRSQLPSTAAGAGLPSPASVG